MNLKRIFGLALLALFALPAANAVAAPVVTDGLVTYDSGIGAGLGVLGLGIGLGLILWGAGTGIGNIGGRATESIARQPEAGGRIFTTMIISAALIEGAALFAIVTVIIKTV